MRYLYISICLLVCLSAAGYNDHRNARIDSLEAALRGNNPPKGKDLLRAYDELMRGWLPFDSQKSLHYGRKALALSYKLGGLNVRQNVLRHFGLIHYGRDEHTAAIDCFMQALAVVDTMARSGRYTEKDIDDARSSLYGSIANDYNVQDKHHLAIHYYQLALPIFEKYGWLESQTVLFHNIGELYFTMGNSQEAERNYLMALSKGQASGDSLMMALARKGLLRLYVDKGDHAAARRVAEKCLAYYRAHRAEEAADYPVVLAAMVRLNLMEGHTDLAAARDFAREAQEKADSLDFENRSDVYAACSQLAMAERQWSKALSYALLSVRPDSLATSADANCYRLLAEIYTELGQKQKARHYVRKMQETMSRYATDHYQSGLSQMEVLYQTSAKEAQIVAMGARQRLFRWLLAATVAMVVALVALLVYRQLAHRRQKALLAARVALETETSERQILARDLHDSLGGMLSLLRLKVAQRGDSTMDEATSLLDDIIAELRRVSHHLMPDELLQRGLVSALHDFAVSVPGARFQKVGAIRLDKERELVLYRCAFELVNNVLKHAQATLIDIQLMQDEHEVTLTVSDDGRGFSVGNRAEGMGLQNIRERISPFNGRLTIVSAPLDSPQGGKFHSTDNLSPQGESEGAFPSDGTANAGTEINVTLPL